MADQQSTALRDKSDYSSMQQRYYDQRAGTLPDARGLVHPDYDLASSQAASTQAHTLLEFVQRTYAIEPHSSLLEVFRRASARPAGLRVLDFGCGVGRLMEPLVDAGLRVDGVDISEGMLGYARQNPKLHESQFFRSSGNDCGGAPESAYDLVYSHLCFQHICSRTIRTELLEAFARALRPDGVVWIQMHFYPDRQAGTVPAPHVSWSRDNFGASGTNSEADVWPTPDELHLVYADFSRFFEDLRFQFVTFPRDTKLFTEAYNSWFAHLVVSGSTRHSLAGRLYAPSSHVA